MQVLKSQQWHLFFLLVLLGTLYFFTITLSSSLKGELFGLPTVYWFSIALLSPILHQLYVLICWRAELFYKAISNFFGVSGFKIFKAGFSLLIFLRLVTIIFLAVSNTKTLNVNKSITIILSAIFTIPVIYLFYSVHRYFKIDRAFGIDHFYPEKYKNGSFIKNGIFKYSSNSMYVFGFLALYIPGLLLQSEAALLIALFNHLYIWVHYYFTELPDIKLIYQEQP